MQIGNVATQVTQSFLQSFWVRLFDFFHGHTAVHLQTLSCGNENGECRLQSALAALNIIEFLRSKVCTESGFGDDIVAIGKSKSCGKHTIASVGNVSKRTSVNQCGRILCGLHQVGVQRILQQHADGSGHTHVLHTERLAVNGCSQQDVFNAAAKVVSISGQTQNGHYLTGRSDVESAFHHHTVGLGAQSGNNLAKVAVIHVEYSLPQHFLQGKTFFTMLIDIVVHHGGNHVVRTGDGVEVACEVEVNLVHGQYLGISAACGSTLHSEAGTQRGFAQRHNGFLANAVHTQCQTYTDGSLANSGFCGGDGGYKNQLVTGYLAVVRK